MPVKEETSALELIKRDLETVKREREKAVRELAEARAEVKALDEQLHKASARLAAKAPPPLPEAAKDCYQLADSATFQGESEGAIKPIITGLPGDLLSTRGVAEAKKLQTALGAGFRVHAVSTDTLKSLDACNLLS